MDFIPAVHYGTEMNALHFWVKRLTLKVTGGHGGITHAGTALKGGSIQCSTSHKSF